jgi:hypothetical protein
MFRIKAPRENHRGRVAAIGIKSIQKRNFILVAIPMIGAGIAIVAIGGAIAIYAMEKYNQHKGIKFTSSDATPRGPQTSGRIIDAVQVQPQDRHHDKQ